MARQVEERSGASVLSVGWIRAAWVGLTRAALAGLLLTILLPGPVLAAPVPQAKPGAAPAAAPAKVESPYARYARDHARSVGAVSPAKVKPSSFSVGHAPRVGQHPRP